jgi:thiosulfate/3-mercaptopyruvate sulfurtransferase
MDQLVSAQWLEDHLGDADLRIFDATVRFVPEAGALRVASGREEYLLRHVPGAGFLDLLSDLSDPESPLRFTRPSATRLAHAFSRAGIARDKCVVVYSASSPMWATRVFWLLRAAGHAAVAVLDGGLARWVEEGRPVDGAPCSYPPAHFVAEPREDLWAAKDEVRAAIGDAATCTIDALPSAVHRGDAGLGYARKGHIAGSVNVPFESLLEPGTGCFRSREELRARLRDAGALERGRAITYCGGGIAATMAALALVRAGHPNVAVYDGSLDEWSRDPSLPMQTGD